MTNKLDSDNIDACQSNIMKVYHKHRKQNLHKMKEIPVFKKNTMIKK